MLSFLRRKSVQVVIGSKAIGGDNPVLVQSMTNTPTEDVLATVQQVQDLAEAGAELVRITVNTREAAQAVPKIAAEIKRRSVDVPIVGDFHFNGHLLLREYPDCARTLNKYRINPGNVGSGQKHNDNFKEMVDIARQWNKPVRIGVNWGSLDAELLSKMMDENATREEPLSSHQILIEAVVESALKSASLAENYGLPHDKIVISAKVSAVPDLLQIYRKLAKSCDYPLHLGLTEAGLATKGIISSTAALSILLSEGIGDTIRASLTPEPEGDRTDEVKVCQQILQSLDIRSFSPQVTACPGCGRTTSIVFQDLAKMIEGHLHTKRSKWQKQYIGVENLKVAVMGCIVNGPGESKHSHIGISLPGTGEEPKAPVYVDGQHLKTLAGPTLVEDFIALVDRYVEEHYSPTSS